MRVVLLFGFLGSGKTTLTRRLIDEWGRHHRIAVIVNEFGDVGIDGNILSTNNVDLIELSSGCVCCTLRGSLLDAIDELRAKNVFEYLIVEASGIAQPGDLAETLGAPSRKEDLEIDAVVTLVDAAKFNKLEKMLGEFYRAQIAGADIVILNKIDLASAQEIEEVRCKVLEVNCDANIFLAEHCDIDLHMLLESRRKAPRSRSQIGNSDCAHEPGSQGCDQSYRIHGIAREAIDVASFVLDAGGYFDSASLRMFFQSLPDAVWRAKGFAVVDGRPALIQYTAGQLDIAAAQTRKNNNLVFIGRGMDPVAIKKLFNELPRHSLDCPAAETMPAQTATITTLTI